MKNIILITFVVFTNFSFSQNLVFTNQNLKDLLLNENCVDLNGDEFGDSNIDLNNDNEIQITEANSIENLVVGSTTYTINSLYDLHQFTNLKRLTVWGDFGLTEISNLDLNSLEHIRISDHNSIIDIDLSDLPSLNSIFIEGLNGLSSLNVQNGSSADNFSLFYTYFNSACVDPIMEEYDIVALNILNDGLPTTNCSLGINENLKEQTTIYPNPSNDEIKIRTDLFISKVTIYDMNGKIVYKSLESNKTLNIKSLENGIYLLIIETKNGNNYSHKIVIK